MSIAPRIAAIVFLVVLSSSLSAQVQRTFVSAGSGSDANPCSRSMPCRNFGAAVANTLAGGEVIVLDSGGYGQVTIPKSISLIAPEGVYAGITAAMAQGGDGIVLNAGASDTVVLRGLTITGLPGDNGIQVFIPIGSLHVESCVIHGLTNSGIAMGEAGKLLVKDTTVRSCGGGINVGFVFASPSGSIEATVDHCRVERTRVGGAINANRGTTLTVRDSLVASNQFGIDAGPVPVGFQAIVNVENCLVTDSAPGVDPPAGGSGIAARGFVAVHGPALVRVSNTMVTKCSVGFHVENGATLESWGNNKVRGNTTDVSGTVTPVTPN